MIKLISVSNLNHDARTAIRCFMTRLDASSPPHPALIDWRRCIPLRSIAHFLDSTPLMRPASTFDVHIPLFSEHLVSSCITIPPLFLFCIHNALGPYFLRLGLRSEPDFFPASRWGDQSSTLFSLLLDRTCLYIIDGSEWFFLVLR